jgi:hypothetical protein
VGWPVAVGLVAAFLTVSLFLAWRSFEAWYTFGSAYTDLRGQNSGELMNRLQVPVMALIVLVEGRLAGLLCPSRRWIAPVIGASPLLLFGLALFAGFGQYLEAAVWCAAICSVALFGAYAPGRLWRRGAVR